MGLDAQVLGISARWVVAEVTNVFSSHGTRIFERKRGQLMNQDFHTFETWWSAILHAFTTAGTHA